MNANEVKLLCLSGSKAYYNYIESKSNGGVEEVRVKKIEFVKNDLFKLSISKKLFELDAVCFQYNGTVREQFTSDDVKIKVYDERSKVIIVKVSKRVMVFISPLVANDWKVIIDLKFLIQRVIDWYALNGNDLLFELRNSHVTQFNNEVYLMDENLGSPTDEQQQALKTVFEHKLSYIWGAPGTGKTRFVLSYALLTYIKAGKKVLIVAPTNAALEQIFRGVIEVTDKANISLNKLLRIGYPSKSFATDFGDICEIQGIEKQLKLISNQIGVIESILGMDTKDLRADINLLKKVQSLWHDKQMLNKEKGKKQKELKKINEELEYIQYKLQLLKEERAIILGKKHSFWIRLFSFFFKSINYDLELERLSEVERGLNREERKKIQTTDTIEFEIEVFVKSSKDVAGQIKDLCNQLDSKNRPNEKLRLRDIELKIVEIEKRLPSEEEQQAIAKSLAEEYRNLSDAELAKIRDELLKEKSRLLKYSLKERIESANVIGATLDGYLYRFKENPISVDHVFLDEAGYASIVKALTVFTTNAPITFLGDHMQLPPVCELSKKDMLQDENFRDVFVWDQSAVYIEELWNSDSKEIAVRNYLRSSIPSFKQLVKAPLTKTHRFGSNLAEVLKRFVYTDGFVSKLERNTEIVVCKVVNPIHLRGQSRLNEAEARCIQAYVTEHMNDESDFAVLAPYRAQVNKIKSLLQDLQSKDNILTVHKSQGQEWETVIYSVCDLGNGRTPWFTDSNSVISNGLNNINTAVSRSKKRLVIFCSFSDWENRNDQLICGLLKAATKVVKYDTSKL